SGFHRGPPRQTRRSRPTCGARTDRGSPEAHERDPPPEPAPAEVPPRDQCSDPAAGRSSSPKYKASPMDLIETQGTSWNEKTCSLTPALASGPGEPMTRQ